MADKIDQLKIGSTSYDIDLPPDATPSVASLTTSGNVSVGGSLTKGGKDVATEEYVKNGTLTIQKNGANVQTFTANQSSNVTANITVPTKDSDLTNDRYVRYDTNSQGLTSTQKSNARTNIGAQQTLTTTVVQDGDLVNAIGFDESGNVVKGSAAIPFATEVEIRALFGH